MPALVLARAMRACGHQAVLVTEGREVEREIMRRELPDVTEVNLPSVHSRMGLPYWLANATVTSRRLLREQAVDCVVSTGGRACLPVGVAARSLGLPCKVDAEKASAEKGKEAYQEAVRQLVRFITWFKERPKDRRRDRHRKKPTMPLP